MENILSDLFYGQISPWERRPARSEEREKLAGEIEAEHRYFIGKMSLDDCQRFQELTSLYSRSASMEQADTFACGFKLGAELMMAVLVESK